MCSIIFCNKIVGKVKDINMKKILFVASESVPFIKTGGLADVIGSLPKNIDKKYFDVRVFIPKFNCMKETYKNKIKYVGHFYMDYNWKNIYVGIMTMEEDGITYYFIDNEYYFNGPLPYYSDGLFEIEKFAFFSKAVLAALPIIDFCPDVIHCHDWHTGLIPVYLHDRFGKMDFYSKTRTIMTIHNLKFQGRWGVDEVRSITGLSDYYFSPKRLESYKDANLLKGGLVYADAITTVSETYAEEIKTEFFGEGLNGLLNKRANSLRGIVNGIDYESFDPENNPMIFKNYTVDTFRKDKRKNKKELQKELGLTIDEKVMMIGIVSRLTDQKGFDLINAVMDELCNENIQIVILGTGENRYENMFRHFDWKYNDKVSANIYYSEELSHKIYAACDAFLMPSLFEPCGLSQLMSLRYGTIPIVRETGGLRDTVEPYNEYESTGTGFSFANYNAHEMLATIRYAESIFYKHKAEWNRIIDRAMKQDFSWGVSALKYQAMYDWLIDDYTK